VFDKLRLSEHEMPKSEDLVGSDIAPQLGGSK
jgi:hypothetical protein